MKKPGQGRYTALYLMSLPSTRHELHLLPQSCTNPLGSSSPTDEKPNEPLGWRAMSGKNVQTSGYFISSIENSVGAAKVINCRRKLVVQNMVDFGSHYIYVAIVLQYLLGNQHILQAVLIGGFEHHRSLGRIRNVMTQHLPVA